MRLVIILLALTLQAQTIAVKHRQVTAGGGGGGTATITRVQQVVSTAACTVDPCNITVTGTTAGNLGVVLMYSQNYAANRIETVSGGGSWTATGACISNVASLSVATDIAYNLSLSGGATTITVSPTAVAGGGVYVTFVEYNASSGAWLLDGSCAHLDNQGATASPTSPSVTTAGAADVIVAVLGNVGFYAGSTTVTGTGWTTPTTMLFPGPSLGTAYSAADDAVGVAAGTYQATFNTYNAAFSSSALAFKAQ